MIVYYTILSTCLYVQKFSLKNVGENGCLAPIQMQVHQHRKLKYRAASKESFGYAKSEIKVVDERLGWSNEKILKISGKWEKFSLSVTHSFNQ